MPNTLQPARRRSLRAKSWQASLCLPPSLMDRSCSPFGCKYKGSLYGIRRVEEACNHRNQPLGAIHKCDMRGPWQYSELHVREADVIAGNATAKESKQFDHVFRTDDIRVPGNEQDGYLDQGNGIIRPVHKLPIQLLHFGDKLGPILWMWRYAGVFLLEWRSGQMFGLERLHSRE